MQSAYRVAMPSHRTRLARKVRASPAEKVSCTSRGSRASEVVEEDYAVRPHSALRRIHGPSPEKLPHPCLTNQRWALEGRPLEPSHAPGAPEQILPPPALDIGRDALMHSQASC